MFDIQNIKRNVSRLAGNQNSIIAHEADSNKLLNAVDHLDHCATLGPATEFNGDLRGQEDICIDGVVDGAISFANHTVTIGEQGRISADISANIVIIAGEVHGNVYGNDKVIVKQTGNVLGDIKAPRVSLEDGAIFKGCIEMEAVPYVERSISSEEQAAQSNSISAFTTVD